MHSRDLTEARVFCFQQAVEPQRRGRRVKDMGWIDAAECDLGWDPSAPEGLCPDAVEFLPDLDCSTELGLDFRSGQEWSWEHLPPRQDLPGGVLNESGPRPTAQSAGTWTGLAVSTLIHAGFLAALFFLPLHTSVGTGDHREKALFVRLTDGVPAVPQEESPGALDSASSVASVARRRRASISEPDKLQRNEPVQPVENQVALRRDSPGSVDLTTVIGREHHEERQEPDKSVWEDTSEVETASRSDSVNSIPSVASPPRGVLAAAGSDVADFRAGVLSAIEEAAYFPKKALTKGILGHTFLRFTIHRNGSVTGLSVVIPSGSEVLDEAALKIIQRAAKRFPAFPERLHSESLSYVVPIVFKAKASAKN